MKWYQWVANILAVLGLIPFLMVIAPICVLVFFFTGDSMTINNAVPYRAPEPDHIFWAKRWMAARKIYVMKQLPSQPGVIDLAMCNYSTYLAEVFSFYFENHHVSLRRTLRHE